MNQAVANSLRWFLVELIIYGALMAGYYFGVLSLLGRWLDGLFLNDRRDYAWIALALIIVQGVFLETLTRLLLSFIRLRTEE
jgi:hypothetical protein